MTFEALESRNEEWARRLLPESEIWQSMFGRFLQPVLTGENLVTLISRFERYSRELAAELDPWDEYLQRYSLRLLLNEYVEVVWFTEKEYDALLAREDNACDPRTVAAFNKVHEMLETAGCLERATLMRVENEKLLGAVGLRDVSRAILTELGYLLESNDG